MSVFYSDDLEKAYILGGLIEPNDIENVLLKTNQKDVYNLLKRVGQSNFSSTLKTKANNAFGIKKAYIDNAFNHREKILEFYCSRVKLKDYYSESILKLVDLLEQK